MLLLLSVSIHATNSEVCALLDYLEPINEQ